MRTESILNREMLDVLTVECTVYEGPVNNGLCRKVSGHEMRAKSVICWSDLVGLKVRQWVRWRVR